MSVVIRPATPDDAVAVVSLLESRALPRDGAGVIVREHPAHALVAELQAEVVASALLDVHGTSALLRSVAVARDVAGLGIGTRIVTDALALARTVGVRTLYLLTTTAADWFPRFGFAIVERGDVPEAIAGTVEFTAACPASATVMRCTL